MVLVEEIGRFMSGNQEIKKAALIFKTASYPVLPAVQKNSLLVAAALLTGLSRKNVHLFQEVLSVPVSIVYKHKVTAFEDILKLY